MIVEKSADEEPAPRHRDRAAALERDVVRRQAAREDRDDRERDREVLEPAHGPEELLRVAELVEDLLVLGDAGAARSRWFAASCSPPSRSPRVAPEARLGAGRRTYTTLARRRLGSSAHVGAAGERQLQREAASGAPRGDRDLAAGAAGEPPGEREPEAGPVGTAGRGGSARARVEDRRLARRRQRRARRRRRRSARRRRCAPARRRRPSGRSGRRCRRAAGSSARRAPRRRRRGPARRERCSRSSTSVPVSRTLPTATRTASRASLVVIARPASWRAAATSVSTVRVIWSMLRSTASSASRYSSGVRSRRSASSVRLFARASGVRSSCDSSAVKRCSCRRLAAIRSSSPSSVEASRVSSSYGSPRSKRRSRSCSLQLAASSAMRETGRNARSSIQRESSVIAPSRSTASSSEPISAVRPVSSYGSSEIAETTVP